MSVTISCTFMCVEDHDEQATRQYLRSIGMKFTNPSLNDEKFIVELREVPELLRQLEDGRYFLGRQTQSWNLLALTAEGLTLYLSHPTAGDGYAHIPMANVCALYSVADSFVDKVRAFAADQLA